MRKWLYIAAATVAAPIASYLAWSRTSEGRMIDALVKSELAHYRALKRQHQEIRDLLEVGNVRTPASPAR